MLKIKKNSLVYFVFSLFVVIALCHQPTFGYVLNTKTKKVHKDSCGEVQKILPENRQDSAAATVSGYTDCQRCNPSKTDSQSASVAPVTPKEPIRTAWEPGKPLQSQPDAAYATELTPKATFPSSNSGRLDAKYDKQTELQWGWVKVQRVVDGDTIVLDNGKTVRFTGVDTPETVKPNTPVQPFGKEASEYTKAFILIGENWVYLEEDGDTTDKYNRQLAMVYIRIPPNDDSENPSEGKNYLLNDMLVLSGLGKAQTQYKYSQEMKNKFLNSENKAKSRKAGIWSNTP